VAAAVPVVSVAVEALAAAESSVSVEARDSDSAAMGLNRLVGVLSGLQGWEPAAATSTALQAAEAPSVGDLRRAVAHR
jgi:hypothetical protein